MKTAILLIALFYITASAQPSAVLTDPRDGKTYRTVKIGAQVWMAENLNYEAEGSKCYGEDGFVCVPFGIKAIKCDEKLSTNEAQANCEKYGRLYDWQTAMKACPKGWHLPSKAEWEYLKVISNQNRNCVTDECNFMALSGGNGHQNGRFSNIGSVGFFWSSSENYYYLNFRKSGRYDNESGLFSIRCVKD